MDDEPLVPNYKFNSNSMIKDLAVARPVFP